MAVRTWTDESRFDDCVQTSIRDVASEMLQEHQAKTICPVLIAEDSLPSSPDEITDFNECLFQITFSVQFHLFLSFCCYCGFKSVDAPVSFHTFSVYTRDSLLSTRISGDFFFAVKITFFFHECMADRFCFVKERK